jgi:hypothetical protein
MNQKRKMAKKAIPTRTKKRMWQWKQKEKWQKWRGMRNPFPTGNLELRTALRRRVSRSVTVQ